MNSINYLTVQNQIKNLSLGHVKGSLVKDLSNFYIHSFSSNYKDLYIIEVIRNINRDIQESIKMTYKILQEINTYFDLLQRDSESFQSEKSTHQWLLNLYLNDPQSFEEVTKEIKDGNQSFLDVLSEFELDKDDFLSYLYNLEIRLRALRDKLNDSNY